MAIRRPLALLVVAVVGLAVPQSAQATGWWNMPCTFWQWNGCGFGGGYHAPLVLGPPTHECFEAPNEVRMPQAPNPYACAPYCGQGGGCETCGHAGGIAPSPVAPSHATTSPEAMRRSPLFVAPVQY